MSKKFVQSVNPSFGDVISFQMRRLVQCYILLIENVVKNTTIIMENPAGKSRGRAGEELTRKTEHHNGGRVVKVFGFLVGKGRAATPVNTMDMGSAGKS